MPIQTIVNVKFEPNSMKHSNFRCYTQLRVPILVFFYKNVKFTRHKYCYKQQQSNRMKLIYVHDKRKEWPCKGNMRWSGRRSTLWIIQAVELRMKSEHMSRIVAQLNLMRTFTLISFEFLRYYSFPFLLDSLEIFILYFLWISLFG